MRAAALLAGLLAILWPEHTHAQQVAPPFTHAHFSEAEQQSARRAFAAARASVDAYVIANPKCAGLITRFERDTMPIAFGLVGGYPELPKRSDGTPVTRPDQLVAVFKDHLPRALLDSGPAALKCVDGYPNRPEWVKSAWYLRVAIDHLWAIDSTLAYANPQPQGMLPGQTVPAVVASHGDYFDDIAQQFWQTHYMRDIAQFGLNAYLTDPRYAAKRPKIRNAQGYYRMLQVWALDVAQKRAGLIPTPDRFCQTLDTLETQTDALNSPKPGMPEVWFALALTLREIVSDDPVQQLMWQSYADSWRRGNASVWGALVFANPAQRQRCGLPPLEAQ